MTIKEKYYIKKFASTMTKKASKANILKRLAKKAQGVKSPIQKTTTDSLNQIPELARNRWTTSKILGSLAGSAGIGGLGTAGVSYLMQDKPSTLSPELQQDLEHANSFSRGTYAHIINDRNINIPEQQSGNLFQIPYGNTLNEAQLPIRLLSAPISKIQYVGVDSLKNGVETYPNNVNHKFIDIKAPLSTKDQLKQMISDHPYLTYGGAALAGGAGLYGLYKLLSKNKKNKKKVKENIEE